MIEKKIIIVNTLGLHARPASKIVALASKFHSQIEFHYKNKIVNAKSIMGVMMLAAAKNTEMLLKANGDDEVAAIEALSQLIDNRFNEME